MNKLAQGAIHRESKIWALIILSIVACFAMMFIGVAVGWTERDYIKFLLLFPIYRAGVEFGLKGGISAGIIVTLLYLVYAPVEPFHYNDKAGVLCIIPMLVFLNLLGVFAGWVVGRGRKANKDAEIISRVMSNIGGGMVEREVLSILAEQATEMTGAMAAAVTMSVAKEDRDDECPVFVYSPEVGVLDIPSLSMDHPLIRCATENEHFFTSGVDADDRLTAVAPTGIKSMLAVSIRSKSGVAGAIALMNKKSGDNFDFDDFSMLQLAADTAGAAIENIRQERRKQEELAREERSKELFSRFVSSAVAEHVLSNPDLLNSRRQEISLMVTDIRGFTAISERLHPQELIKRLNEYFTVIVDVVFNRNGTIDKYIGDCVIAYWGAPAPDECHAQNAALAALDTISALDSLNKKWKSEGKETFNTGISVHTGNALVGNVGDNRKMMFTVMGEQVEKAVKTESMTKLHGERLIVTAQTARLIDEDFIVEAIPGTESSGMDRLFSLKGAKQ